MYHEFTFDLTIGPNAADVIVTLLVCYAIVVIVAGGVVTAIFAAKAAR